MRMSFELEPYRNNTAVRELSFAHEARINRVALRTNVGEDITMNQNQNPNQKPGQQQQGGGQQGGQQKPGQQQQGGQQGGQQKPGQQQQGGSQQGGGQQNR